MCSSVVLIIRLKVIVIYVIKPGRWTSLMFLFNHIRGITSDLIQVAGSRSCVENGEILQSARRH